MQITVNNKTTYAGTLGRPFDTAKPTVVFLHGAAMDHTVWSMFARYFVRHGYNSVALDLPGHGRSEGPPLDRVEALAEFVDDCLDALNAGPVCVVGHSLGSLIALQFAATSKRAVGVGLVGTGVPMPVSDPLLDAAEQNTHASLDMINVWGHSPSGQVGGISSPGIWMTGAQLRLTERAGPGVLFADLTACNEFGDGLSCAAAIECPVALILGERDMMTPPRATRELQKQLTHVTTTLIPKCGHALMSEKPNEVLDALVGLTGQVAWGEVAA